MAEVPYNQILILLVYRLALSAAAPVYLLEKYSEEELFFDTRQTNVTTPPPTGLQACATTFCPEAIANVTAVSVVVIFLTVLACSLWHYQVQQVRLSRIRQALERNRALDRHLASKAQKQEEMTVTTPSSSAATESSHQSEPPNTNTQVEIHTV